MSCHSSCFRVHIYGHSSSGWLWWVNIFLIHVLLHFNPWLFCCTVFLGFLFKHTPSTVWRHEEALNIVNNTKEVFNSHECIGLCSVIYNKCYLMRCIMYVRNKINAGCSECSLSATLVTSFSIVLAHLILYYSWQPLHHIPGLWDILTEDHLT